jgi:hypothetical protein
MGACFSSIYDVALGNLAPAGGGSASGAFSAACLVLVWLLARRAVAEGFQGAEQTRSARPSTHMPKRSCGR